MSASQEVTNHYNKLKNEYTEIFKRYIELEEERRENNLVLANLEPLAARLPPSAPALFKYNTLPVAPPSLVLYYHLHNIAIP